MLIKDIGARRGKPVVTDNTPERFSCRRHVAALLFNAKGFRVGRRLVVERLRSDNQCYRGSVRCGPVEFRVGGGLAYFRNEMREFQDQPHLPLAEAISPPSEADYRVPRAPVVEVLYSWLAVQTPTINSRRTPAHDAVNPSPTLTLLPVKKREGQPT